MIVFVDILILGLLQGLAKNSALFGKYCRKKYPVRPGNQLDIIPGVNVAWSSINQGD